MSEDRQDAVETIRFVVMDAVAATSHIHRMSPDAARLVVDEILASLFSPATRWAVRKICDSERELFVRLERGEG